MWGLVWSGKIKAKRVGRRVLIPDSSIQEFIASTQDYLSNNEVDRG
jgi:hypothetical protein